MCSQRTPLTRLQCTSMTRPRARGRSSRWINRRVRLPLTPRTSKPSWTMTRTCFVRDLRGAALVSLTCVSLYALTADAISNGEMFSLNMDSMIAASSDPLSWTDVGAPSFNTQGYEPVMALAQNHIQFLDVPGTPDGQADIFVIHCKISLSTIIGIRRSKQCNNSLFLPTDTTSLSYQWRRELPTTTRSDGQFLQVSGRACYLLLSS